jgi:quercetin dioxygenase-like cupin family protein
MLFGCSYRCLQRNGWSGYTSGMPFSTRKTDVGVTAGAEHGLRRLIVRVQPVAPHVVGHLHRHDGDQILIVLEGEVLIEVDGDGRICHAGELGIAPAGAVHGFLGLEEPALLEVFGEQACGTEFLLSGGESLEVHRPGVPWDRPGPPTDMSVIEARGFVPRRP